MNEKKKGLISDLQLRGSKPCLFEKAIWGSAMSLSKVD